MSERLTMLSKKQKLCKRGENDYENLPGKSNCERQDILRG